MYTSNAKQNEKLKQTERRNLDHNDGTIKHHFVFIPEFNSHLYSQSSHDYKKFSILAITVYMIDKQYNKKEDSKFTLTLLMLQLLQQSPITL